MKSLSNKEIEISKSILEWLKNIGYTKTLTAMLEETGLSKEEIPSKNDLDKKWNSILMMNKKISSLETELKTLKEDIEQSKLKGIAYTNKKDNSESQFGLPRLPEKRSIQAHRHPITCIIFHPVFNLLISCSEDATISVWEIINDDIKQEQFIRGHTNCINHITFDSLGKLLSSCSSDLTIKIWKFDNPLKCLKTLNGHEHSVSSIEFSLDSNLLFSASRDKTIKVWDVNTGFCKTTLKSHSEWVRSISLNDSGSLLASCGDDEKIIIWQVDQSIERYTLYGHNNKIEKVVFVKNKQAKQVIFKADFSIGEEPSPQKESSVGSLKINNEQMEKLNDLNRKLMNYNQVGSVNEIDKEYLFSCSRDKTIRLYEVNSEKCLYVFEGHDNWVRDILLHPSGKYLLSTGDDRSIRGWDLSSGRCLKKLEYVHEKFVNTISINEKLGVLCSGSNDLMIKLFDCK